MVFKEFFLAVVAIVTTVLWCTATELAVNPALSRARYYRGASFTNKGRKSEDVSETVCFLDCVQSKSDAYSYDENTKTCLVYKCDEPEYLIRDKSSDFKHLAVMASFDNDVCARSACINDGLCVADGKSSYRCVCRIGFTGQRCESEIEIDTADLIISGAIDVEIKGSKKNPKTVELYAIKDIPNLNVYGIGRSNEGDGAEYTWTFPSRSAKAGQFLYVSTAKYGGEFEPYFKFTPDHLYEQHSLYFSGDDSLILYKHGKMVDVLGEIDKDGTGREWDYKDSWAYRRDSHLPQKDFDASHWRFGEKDAVYRYNSVYDGPDPFPMGTFKP